jgi:hypothetical protein
MARVICSIFWFVPVVWFAYMKLYLEQEKSCDLSVINEGVQPNEYASHILEMVKELRGNLLIAGVYGVSVGKNMLEKRIANVMNLSRSKIKNKGGSKIRTTKLFFITISLIAFIILLSSCATQKTTQKEKLFEPLDNDELTGVWVNTEYAGQSSYGHQKIVITHYGYSKIYSKVNSVTPRKEATLYVVEKWTDSEGNLWCKSIWRDEHTKNFYHELEKISNDGKTWEYVYTTTEFPSESDLTPDNARYYIYYRQ